MEGGEIVGIDLDKAALLAGELGRAQLGAQRLAGELRGALEAGGEGLEPASVLLGFAVWADLRRATLRGMIRAIGAWPDPLGPRIWHSDQPGAFAHPGPAVDAADALERALAQADTAGAATLLRAWAGDAVFASVVVGRLGPMGIVDRGGPARRPDGLGPR